MSDFLVIVAIAVLWIAAVFDPVGGFSVRYFAIFLGLIGLCVVFLLGRVKANYFRDSFVGLYVFFMPAYGLLLYIFYGGYAGEFIDTSYIAAAVLLCFCYLYVDQDVCIYSLRWMVVSLRLLSILICSIYALTAFGFDTDWISIFTERDAARVSFREYGGLTFPYIYFYSSPMLIYLIGYDLERFRRSFGVCRFFLLVLSVFSLGLSGTRSHMLLAAALPVLFYVSHCDVRRVVSLSLILIVVAAAVSVIDMSFLGLFFDPSETSNSMKIGMLNVYGDIFNWPGFFLFGQGYNAHSWSSDLRSIISTELGASKTELTFLELIRVYGLVVGGLGIFFLGFIVLNIAKLGVNFRWVAISFFVYLVNAFTNPYLFSTNGALPIILFLSVIVHFSRSSDSGKFI